MVSIIADDGIGSNSLEMSYTVASGANLTSKAVRKITNIP